MPIFSAAISQTLYDYINGLITAEQAGPDVVALAALLNPIFGTDGEDRLSGTSAADVLFGGASQDFFFGGKGNDLIYTGSGTDYVRAGAGDDTLLGEDGDDRLWGDNGNDLIYGGIGRDRIYGGADDDTMYGGDDADIGIGGSGNDSLYGGLGNDAMRGGIGDDRLWGDDGDDRISGDAGDDKLYGGIGDNTLIGGSGNDIIHLDNGVNIATGGAGSDVFIFQNGGATDAENVITDFQLGTDTIQFGGVTFSADRFYSSGSVMRYLVDGEFVEVGNIFQSEQGVVIRAFNVPELGLNSGQIILAGVSLEDVGLTNLLRGTEGNDRLASTDAIDMLLGYGGNDLLIGGAGDILTGGDGADFFYLPASNVTITDFEIGVDRIRYDLPNQTDWETINLNDFSLHENGSLIQFDRNTISVGTYEDTDSGVVLTLNSGLVLTLNEHTASELIPQQISGIYGDNDDNTLIVNADDTLVYGGRGADYITLTGEANFDVYGDTDTGLTTNYTDSDVFNFENGADGTIHDFNGDRIAIGGERLASVRGYTSPYSLDANGTTLLYNGESVGTIEQIGDNVRIEAFGSTIQINNTTIPHMSIRAEPLPPVVEYLTATDDLDYFLLDGGADTYVIDGFDGDWIYVGYGIGDYPRSEGAQDIYYFEEFYIDGEIVDVRQTFGHTEVIDGSTHIFIGLGDEPDFILQNYTGVVQYEI